MSGEPMGRHYRTAIYWFSGMAAVLVSLAVWSISYIAGMSLALVAAAFLGAALGVRCPRCGLGVDSRERWLRGWLSALSRLPQVRAFAARRMALPVSAATRAAVGPLSTLS